MRPLSVCPVGRGLAASVAASQATASNHASVDSASGHGMPNWRDSRVGTSISSPSAMVSARLYRCR